MPRRKNDAYYSPSVVAQWLLEYERVGIKGTILECASGEGAISNPLKEAGYAVWTNDIDPEVVSDYSLDITSPESWENLPRLDWVITNPPFSALNELLPLAFNQVNVGVAFYIRKSATEPCYDRQDWLQEHQEHFAQAIYCPRISFTGDGKTEKVACDWYIWTKEKCQGTISAWVKKERRERKQSTANQRWHPPSKRSLL